MKKLTKNLLIIFMGFVMISASLMPASADNSFSNDITEEEKLEYILSDIDEMVLAGEKVSFEKINKMISDLDINSLNEDILIYYRTHNELANAIYKNIQQNYDKADLISLRALPAAIYEGNLSYGSKGWNYKSSWIPDNKVENYKSTLEKALSDIKLRGTVSAAVLLSLSVLATGTAAITTGVLARNIEHMLSDLAVARKARKGIVVTENTITGKVEIRAQVSGKCIMNCPAGGSGGGGW